MKRRRKGERERREGGKEGGEEDRRTLFLYISYSLEISQSFSTSFSKKARSSAEICYWWE